MVNSTEQQPKNVLEQDPSNPQEAILSTYEVESISEVVHGDTRPRLIKFRGERKMIQKKKYNKFLIFILLLFLGIIGFFLILHRAPYAPDQFYVIVLIFVLFMGRIKSFIRDWTPPIILILVYEYLRGLIPRLNIPVHFYPMIQFDKFIFGQLPTVYLQKWLFSIVHLHWYDYLSAFFYSSHFVIPLFIAFIFWINNRKKFESYIFGMVGLSYISFLTYFVFPAAPPWLAAQNGLIPPIQHITDIVFGHFFTSISLPTLYRHIGANLVAAVPSLHVAYAFFTALFIGKKFSKLIPVLVLYVFGVSFATVYMGEHYFFDVVLGAVYAFVVYFCIQNWDLIKKRLSFKTNI